MIATETRHTRHAADALDVELVRFGPTVLVAFLTGRLDRPGAPTLRQALRQLPQAEHWVVLDLANVPELHPDALPILATTQRRLLAHGTRLALRNLRAQPRRVFHDAAPVHRFDIVSGDLRAWLAERPAPSYGLPEENWSL